MPALWICRRTDSATSVLSSEPATLHLLLIFSSRARIDASTLPQSACVVMVHVSFERGSLATTDVPAISTRISGVTSSIRITGDTASNRYDSNGSALLADFH
jgi:hypothetical protein